MSAEDDLATIQAVTDKIAGPMKVWVLRINGDGADYVLLHWTIDGAVNDAQMDMETKFKTPISKSEIDRAIVLLRERKYVELRDTHYRLNCLGIGE